MSLQREFVALCFNAKRGPRAARRRWHNHLSPSVRKGPWTEAEDAIIADAHRKLGNRWVDIALLLTGRSGPSASVVSSPPLL